MAKPYVMNRDQVKSYLGISDASYDTQIDLFLPAVSDALVGNPGILGSTYLVIFNGTTSVGSDEITGVSDGAIVLLAIGDIIESSAFPAGSEITAIDEDNNIVTVSQNATTAGEEEIETRVLPVGAKPTVAQMVIYRITGGTVSGANAQITGKKSEKYGPISITYADDGAMSSSGFPKRLIKGLWPYKRPMFA